MKQIKIIMLALCICACVVSCDDKPVATTSAASAAPGTDKMATVAPTKTDPAATTTTTTDPAAPDPAVDSPPPAPAPGDQVLNPNSDAKDLIYADKNTFSESYLALIDTLKLGDPTDMGCGKTGVCGAPAAGALPTALVYDTKTSTFYALFNARWLKKVEPNQVQYFKNQKTYHFEHEWKIPEKWLKKLKMKLGTVVKPGDYTIYHHGGTYGFIVPLKPPVKVKK